MTTNRAWVKKWATGSVAAGLMMLLVGLAFHYVAPVAFPGLVSEYGNKTVFRPWFGWTRWYMAMHPFLFGGVFAGVYLLLGRMSGFPRGVKGGLQFGTGLFTVGSLPVFLLNFASFQVSPLLIISWMIQNLLQYAAAGMVLGCVCDGAIVHSTTKLKTSASRVWELLLLKSTFLYITRGMMAYSGAEQWPERIFGVGVVLNTNVRLFGWAPASPHFVRVERVDAENREIETAEHGGHIQMWNHRMHVEPVSDTACRYTDYVEIHAGLLTPLVWLIATVFYRVRQHRWRSLIAADVAEE